MLTRPAAACKNHLQILHPRLLQQEPNASCLNASSTWQAQQGLEDHKAQQCWSSSRGEESKRLQAANKANSGCEAHHKRGDANKDEQQQTECKLFGAQPMMVQAQEGCRSQEVQLAHHCNVCSSRKACRRRNKAKQAGSHLICRPAAQAEAVIQEESTRGEKLFVKPIMELPHPSKGGSKECYKAEQLPQAHRKLSCSSTGAANQEGEQRQAHQSCRAQGLLQQQGNKVKLAPSPS